MQLTICNTADVGYLEFSTFSLFMLFCFRVENFAEIGLSAADIWPKTIIKMAAVCHLEFQKCSYLVT